MSSTRRRNLGPRLREEYAEPELPSELYHNWAEDLMYDAKIGWREFKGPARIIGRKYVYPQNKIWNHDGAAWWLIADLILHVCTVD